MQRQLKMYVVIFVKLECFMNDNIKQCTKEKNIINVGGELLSSLDVLRRRISNGHGGSRPVTCVKQILSANANQFVLTRTGKATLAYSRAGNSMVIPIKRGNVIVQTMTQDDRRTICCAVVAKATAETVLLYPTDDDVAFEAIESMGEQIIDAIDAIDEHHEWARLNKSWLEK